MNYFSKNIRFLRNRIGLNQAEMLDHLGFPRTTWSSYENGVSQPDIDGLLRIASFFGISATELLVEDLKEGGHPLPDITSDIAKRNEALEDSFVKYKSADRAERLLNEVIQTKQQVIESQEQTIHALQSLVKQLNSELAQLRSGKE